MSEQQTPVAVATEPATPPTPSPAPASKPKKGASPVARKRRQRIIGTIITLAVVAGIGFGLWWFVFRETTEQGDIMMATAELGSIQSSVQGSGRSRAKETSAITLTANGIVEEVFVTEGQQVFAGDPLYRISSQTAQEAYEKLSKELADLYEEQANLTVTAPYSGKLIDVQNFTVGQTVSKGSKVATLVNDKKLKLSLYYSYAYENDISVGQTVTVAIPATMSTVTDAKVEAVHKVNFITPEGSNCFEVVISFNNPGTLTAGMDASATLTAADGTVIYPYENTKLEYYEVQDVVAKASGPLLSYSMLNYADVTAGQPLMYLGGDDNETAIRAKQEEVDKAQKDLANFNAVAPIDGMVTSCSLTPGKEVKSGDLAITISNTTTMIVEITVDDRNISFIKSGMTVDLTDYNGNTFMGTVTNIDMSLSGEGGMSGMTSYPVTLEVDNSAGTLLAGQWLDYSFVTSQSDNCVMVPIQCVKSISDMDGNPVTVVFIQADQRPENAVESELPEPAPGEMKQYPTEADGYYPVPVETGLSDKYNVEITSGLNAGDVVFNGFMTTTM